MLKNMLILPLTICNFFTVSVQSQFCDDIDRLIMEEENRMSHVESGDESATNNPKLASKETKKPRKKKPYKRYTPEQIKGMRE